jgi:hypothetical protein
MVGSNRVVPRHVQHAETPEAVRLAFVALNRWTYQDHRSIWPLDGLEYVE